MYGVVMQRLVDQSNVTLGLPPKTLLSDVLTGVHVQGYLAHKKQPPPVGPPYSPGHNPTVGSLGGAVSYERGAPVRTRLTPPVAAAEPPPCGLPQFTDEFIPHEAGTPFGWIEP